MGGGGWGSTSKRSWASFIRCTKKLVSIEGARRYGVVINENLTLNEKDTKALRAEMSKETVKDEMFNFGGTIDEIVKSPKKHTWNCQFHQPF